MSGKRIGFDARYINDRYHGIGRFAFRLLEALLENDTHGAYIIYRGRGQDTRFDWREIARHPHVEFQPGPWPLYYPYEHLAWLKILRRSRLDVFHSPYFTAPLLPLGINDRIPTVITVHDLIFDRYPEFMPRRWAHPYYRAMMKLNTRQARKVITVSQATARDLRAYYRTPLTKLSIIPEGVDPDFQMITDPGKLARLQGKYNLPNPVLLAVGARRPHKNFARLVQAFHHIAPNVKHDLVFVGPPDKRFPDKAQAKAAELGMNGRVRFLNWVPEEDLSCLYSLADLVVIPSLIEGFGLPALEALACGTLVLAADNTSLPEVVGEAGLLFDPYNIDQMADKLYRLLQDANLRQRYGALCRPRAKQFTWRSAAQRTLELYSQVLR